MKVGASNHSLPISRPKMPKITAHTASRIQTLTPRAVALAREQQEQIQELAVAELLQQKQRLAAYAMQARFAVAQLYDRATLATHEAGDAKQP